MKKEKVLVLALSMLFANVAIAEPYNGFYVGGELGGNHYNAEIQDGTKNIDGAGADGFAYGVYAGYQVKNGTAVFGLEGEIGDSTAKFSYKDTAKPADNGSLTDNLSYGLALRGGVLITDTLLYAKLGWQNTRFESRDNVSKDHENLNGFKYGVGIEKSLNNTTSIRGEYMRTSYEDYKPDATSSIDGNQGAFLVGLSYNF